jgi:hypothetical protein
MINYTTNQRRALRWDTSVSGNPGWMEEILAASGVAVDASGFHVVSGTEAQQILQSLDNTFNGFNVATASGVITIDDISNVSGAVGEIVDNLDVVTLGSGSNSVVRFSFAVPAQPIDPVNVRLYFIPRGNGSGNIKYSMDYNIFDQGDNVSPGVFSYTGVVDTYSVTSGSLNKMKLSSFAIPPSNFNASGSAPYLVNCRVTRDVSVSGNFGNDASIVQLYADNIPGGILGQTAGYLGGNLTVDGNLVVQGTTTLSGLAILQGGTAPVASGSAGTSGSLVIADDFLYAAVTTNKWKRTALSAF